MADFAADEMAEELSNFGKNGMITLQQFGWQELKTEDGVKYKWG